MRQDTERIWCACRLIAALGCMVHFVGYIAVWLAAKGIVPLPFPVLLCFALLGSSAVVFFDSATIVTCMRNFPNERGNSAGRRSFHPVCTVVRGLGCKYAAIARQLIRGSCVIHMQAC